MRISIVKRCIGASFLLALAPLVTAVVARAQDNSPGVAGQAGQVLDNAGRGIRQGIENSFARHRASVHDQEVVARVYSRIHWDKVLVGSTIELEVLDGGSTVLRGLVPDLSAKQRAVILARDTVGVTQVVDELTVIAKPRVIPAPAP